MMAVMPLSVIIFHTLLPPDVSHLAVEICASYL